MKEIIAMHGWAGNSHEWANWKTIFKSCDWEWQTSERGYKDKSPHISKWNHNSNHIELKRVVVVLESNELCSTRFDSNEQGMMYKTIANNRSVTISKC